MSKRKRSFLESYTWIDWLLTIAAFGFIGYGLYSAYLLDPEKWSYVAGPLFSLSSGLLFVLALRVQLREHRQAIDEMEQANANHEDLLIVASQEKEFNTCLSVMADLNTHIATFQHGLYGISGLREVTTFWAGFFSLSKAEAAPQRFAELVNDIARADDQVLPKILLVDTLFMKLTWLREALRTKDLDDRDREYIQAMLIPQVTEVKKATAENIMNAIQGIQELMKRPEFLADYGIFKQSLEHWQSKLVTLADRDKAQWNEESWASVRKK